MESPLLIFAVGDNHWSFEWDQVFCQGLTALIALKWKTSVQRKALSGNW